jgi:hypothetical protein
MEVIIKKIENSKYKNNLKIILNTINYLNNNLDNISLMKINDLLIHEYYNNIEFTNFLCEIININNNINYDFNKNNNIFNDDFESQYQSLDNKGVLIFKKIFSSENINLLLNKLNNKKMYNNSNGNLIYNNIDIFKNNNNVWWLANPNQIYQFDFIQQLITNSYILKLIQKYLRSTPIFFSSNFWVSYPGKIENTQIFHQDFDDIKFLKIFIYLNDVNEENGPHFYVQSSLNNIINKNNLPSNYKASDRINDNFFNNYKKDILKITGNEGTIILEDTKGFHKGSNVKSGRRYILQLLFGVSNIFKLNYPNYEKIKLDKNISSILYEAKEKYPFIYQNFIF